MLLYCGDAIADYGIGQTGTVKKYPLPDSRDAIGDGDTCQTGAVLERQRPDIGNTVGDRHAGQALAV